MIGPLLIAGVFRLLELGRLPRFGLHFLAVVLFCSLWTGFGVARGNLALDAIGIFRRFAFYPSIYLVTAAALEDRPLPRAPLWRAVIAAGVIISLQTLYRLATGEGYAHDYFTSKDITLGGVSRWTSFIEILAPVLGLFLVAGSFTGRVTIRRRLAAMALGALFLLPVIASNFRSAWVGLILGCGVWLFLAGRRALAALKWAGVVGALGIGVAVAVNVVADPTGAPTHKFSPENLALTSSWRAASWKAAARSIAGSPVTGRGFGHKHRFTYARAGQPVAAQNTIHNDVLWVVVEGGLIGALLILGFHLRWLLWCVRGLRRAREEEDEPRNILAGVLAAYATIALVCCFQPVFHLPSIVMSISMLMAIAAAFAAGVGLEKSHEQAHN